MNKTSRKRVLEILQIAMTEHLYLNNSTKIYYQGQDIPVKDGFVPQSVFANPTITGSTEGKRRFRELRADPELQKKYNFEVKKIGKTWGYRIMPKNHVAQNRLQFAEV